MITGDLMSADQVLSTGKDAVVLDRLRNAVFELDVPRRHGRPRACAPARARPTPSPTASAGSS